MRILFFDRRQHVKEKDFQITFVSDLAERLRKFSGHCGVSAGESLFSARPPGECSRCLGPSQGTRRLLLKQVPTLVGYRDPLVWNPNIPLDSYSPGVSFVTV